MVRVRYSVSQFAIRIMRKNSSTSPFSPISTNTYQLTTLRHTHVLDLKKSSHTRDTMTLKCTLRWLLFFSGRGFRHSVSDELGIYTNSQVFESALPSGHFWIRYESGIAWTLNPDIFFFIRWRKTVQFFTVNTVFKKVTPTPALLPIFSE